MHVNMEIFLHDQPTYHGADRHVYTVLVDICFMIELPGNLDYAIVQQNEEYAHYSSHIVPI